jgi:phosphoesterase RecJ-like protein
MRNMEQVIKKIGNAETIAIAGHVNPDGDCIGSLLSLGLGLEKLGKKVTMISADGVPGRYGPLPGADRIKRRVGIKPDLSITVDCNKKAMLGEAAGSLMRADTVIEIDHHESREKFGDIALIDEMSPSVGEMIYKLLNELDVGIDRDIAMNILTSVIVETNSFRLPNVRPRTFKICAELVETGLDFYQLTDMVFWSHSRVVSVLSGVCMARSRFLEGGRLAWTEIRREDLREHNGKDEDVDAVPDELRSIRDVEIAIFFREKEDNNIRVSLRSKKQINVAGIAEHYGGGGHIDVAGCVIPNRKAARDELIERARRLL